MLRASSRLSPIYYPGSLAQFAAATALTLVTLFAVGVSCAFIIGRGWLVSELEMLLVGALPAGVAYGVGVLRAAIID